MHRDKAASPIVTELDPLRRTDAGQDGPEARARVILSDLLLATDQTTDDETALEAVVRAFSGVLREHAHGQISAAMRESLLTPFFTVEGAAQALLPTEYWAARGHHGFISVYSLIDAWASPPGSAERAKAHHPSMCHLVRILVNDLDSQCAAFALRRSSPGYAPRAVPMPAQRITKH